MEILDKLKELQENAGEIAEAASVKAEADKLKNDLRSDPVGTLSRPADVANVVSDIVSKSDNPLVQKGMQSELENTFHQAHDAAANLKGGETIVESIEKPILSGVAEIAKLMKDSGLDQTIASIAGSFKQALSEITGEHMPSNDQGQHIAGQIEDVAKSTVAVAKNVSDGLGLS